jgi:hypothetical protein
MLMPFAAVLALLPPLAAPLPPSDLLTVQYPSKGGTVLIYDGASTVTWLVPTKLDPEGQAEFNDIFVAQGYFGAWAMSDNGGYGYASGSGTIEAAREIAMAQCVGSNPQGCQIVAELLPDGWYPAGPQDIPLSEQVAREWLTEGRDAFRAVSISEDGAYAVVWGHASQADANAAALRDCQSGLMALNVPIRAMPCILVPGY